MLATPAREEVQRRVKRYGMTLNRARQNGTKGNAEFARGNGATAAPVREAGNALVLPISPDLARCPTCQQYFYRVQNGQRYCCSQHRVTGAKRRRKRLTEAFVIIATTMSGGRISEARALDCIEWNYERCVAVVAAWGYTFNERDELVRVKT